MNLKFSLEMQAQRQSLGLSVENRDESSSKHQRFKEECVKLWSLLMGMA